MDRSCGNLLLQTNKCFNPKYLLTSIIVFSVYCIYVAIFNFSKCLNYQLQSDKTHKWESFRPFENGILLEYNSQSVICNETKTNKNCKNETSTKLLKPLSIMKETFRSYRHSLKDCDNLKEFWSSNEFASFKPVMRNKDDGDVNLKQGETNFFGPRITVATEEAFFNTDGYATLYHKYKTRFYLGWNLEWIPQLLGACVTPEYVRMVSKLPEGIPICDVDEDDQDFVTSSCYRLEKLNTIIRKHEDSTKATLTVAQSFICFLGELEVRRFFIQDFHGSQFNVLPDMSIMLNDFNNIFYYGKQNILGGNLCWKDAECSEPFGAKWNNGSANKEIYRNCWDIAPFCSRTSDCKGFNSTVHLCGLSNWILNALSKNIEKPQDRGILRDITIGLLPPNPHARKSGKEACNQITRIIQRYNEEKKRDSNKRIGSFHLGKKKH